MRDLASNFKLCAANSFSHFCTVSALACLALLSTATVARADVMELGARGFVWVAGAPVSNPSQIIEVGPSPEIELTSVSDSAGPAPWRPHVAMLAKKYDISPALLEAVVWQESRWQTQALSIKGAQGLAQLMPGTAREMGVDIANPMSNLEGGARYLKIQLDRFDGDIEKALAAYNAGPSRVIRAGGIPQIPETKAYVSAIMSRLAESVRRSPK
jgi:soluble lytic murein transglycosylase-like protein